MSYTGGWGFESPSSAFVLKQQLKTRWANRSRLVQATIVYYFIIYLLSIIGMADICGICAAGPGNYGSIYYEGAWRCDHCAGWEHDNADPLYLEQLIGPILLPVSVAFVAVAARRANSNPTHQICSQCNSSSSNCVCCFFCNLSSHFFSCMDVQLRLLLLLQLVDVLQLFGM